MIRFLPQETAIVVGTQAGATLEVAWVLESNFGSTRVELQLDRNMLAKPTNYENAITLDLHVGWPSISVSPPAYLVSEDRRTILFDVRNVSLLAKTKKSVQKLPIHFEWRNPYCLPNRIDIKVSMKSGLSEARPITLTGYNCERGMIEFLNRRNESTFYFPSACSVLELPYWEFAREASYYQSAPNTTVKAVTWPSELAYWLSREGTDYLVSQVRKITRTDRASIPTRIVICPLELGGCFDDSAPFLQEMEVHARLGVTVRAVSPKRVFDLLSGEFSIATYGNGLALEFRGTNSELSNGALAVMLDAHRIDDILLLLDELQSISEPWPDYLRRVGIDFSSEEAGVAVFNRYRYILGLLP
jgi:hypothetical protein